MCDIHDVVNASHEAADVIVSALYDYGGNNLGNGIRKAIDEAYELGFKRGCEELLDVLSLERCIGYANGRMDGMVKGSVIGAGTVVVVGIVSFGVMKLIKYKANKSEKIEEDTYNGEL